VIHSGILAAPVTESVRRLALGHLDSAAAALDRMDDEDDVEALHDFRVSLRRLRTILRSYRPNFAPEVRMKERRAIRKLARSTGAGRDAEVLLDWLESVRDDLAPSEGPMADRLAAELRAERDWEYGDVLEKVGPRFRKLEKRLRRRLGSFELPAEPSRPGVERSFAATLNHVLPVYAAQLSDAVDAIHTPEDHDAVHAARIRGKRLRYLVESVATEVDGVDLLVDRLKGLQDALGDLRDAQLLELRVRASDVARRKSRNAVKPGPGDARLGVLLTREQDARFADFEAGWRGAAKAGFHGDVEAIRRRIADATPDPLEIERKYLLSGAPTAVSGHPAREFEQGYLPGTRIQERLRRIVDADRILHVRSIKLGSGLVRVEVQEEIDTELFDRLWPLTDGRRLTKKRYRIADGDLVWEVDEFTDRDLWLAEVELPSADHEAEPPEWLEPYIVREVTDEPEYLNVNLAR
jgi:CHAD domain-containing protein/CYTH domain-containing protein